MQPDVTVFAGRRRLDLESHKVAAHFRFPLQRVNAAIHYYEAYPGEIDQSIACNAANTFDTLKRHLPQLEAIAIPKSILDSAL